MVKNKQKNNEDAMPPLPEFDAPGFRWVQKSEKGPGRKSGRRSGIYEDKDGKIRPAVPGEVVPGFRWVQKSEKGVGVEPGAHKSLFWYLGVPAVLNLVFVIWLVWRVG